MKLQAVILLLILAGLAAAESLDDPPTVSTSTTGVLSEQANKTQEQLDGALGPLRDFLDKFNALKEERAGKLMVALKTKVGELQEKVKNYLQDVFERISGR